MADVLPFSARPGFRLTVVDLDPLRATIRAAGELDLAARQPLTALLQQQLIAGRRIISLDLSEVTFLDCSCVGVLVAAHHRFLELRGLLVLTEVDARVARILRATGLEDSLFMAPTGARPSRPRAS
jgi:anti-sigma B factor antagonist